MGPAKPPVIDLFPGHWLKKEQHFTEIGPLPASPGSLALGTRPGAPLIG